MIITIALATTAAATGLTTTLGIVAVVGLATFLVTKELAGARGSASSLRIAKFVNVGILPLTIAFAVIILGKVAGMLF